ncbi:aspartate--ammonia ligase [Halosquirtibacter laminarini]|uniref:Aspartate--ammonia ligase n=1 Tax=Halosquirtibacter laminarini TaxID=3374600 RepID=A0AC61NQB9_9BACT|nr:aspartate--ammonia ligase [Prolixibacteraceae bacterium]
MILTIPEGYQSALTLKETEKAIKFVKDFFQQNLSSELRLRRVTAPLFVMQGTGINDDLNGIERAVSFPVKELGDAKAEVVHSLAKWKRMMLGKYDIPAGYGLYTDMNAIRADEELTNLHSMYVDQWDWEASIRKEDRNLDFLKKMVQKIYGVLLRTEFMVYEYYPAIKPVLPEEITFIHTEDLEKMYPELTPFERETEVAKKFGAVFIIGIGGKLPFSDQRHDGRAPDYDDWSTETLEGKKGLNGDIILWNPTLKRAFEVSSMGIRVDKDALKRQLVEAKQEDREKLMWHQMLLNDEMPLSIGGGIGQSRMCMFFLQKAHIGEVQASIWPDKMIEECTANGITLI